MKRLFFCFACCASISLAASMTTACSDKDETPDWEWEDPTPPTPPDPDQPKAAKPRFIWVDAAANFPDFANSRENIARDLAKAKNAGFTDIVVDVRPTSGDVLFKTDAVEQVEWLGAWITGGGYQKFERTADWDYLQAFIDEGKKLDLRIHAAINTFTGGSQNPLGNIGAIFRDEAKAKWATELNLETGITSILKASDYTTKFYNPVLPEVQEYLCSMLADLARYDGLTGIFLDRARFDGFTSDFSDYTRQQFEAFLGQRVGNFPGDILPAGHKSGIPTNQPQYMKKWLEFRAKVIHDFMEKARARVKQVNPSLKFGVYVGGWYSTYYDVGVNWASPKYDTAARFPTWATTDYKNYGYADLMDQMLIGAYASPGRVTGTTEWTMQGFCLLAKERTAGACPMVAGGPDVGNWNTDGLTQAQVNQAITASVAACYNACDGYFLFDMIHLKKADQWSYVKAGIDTVLNQ